MNGVGEEERVRGEDAGDLARGEADGEQERVGVLERGERVCTEGGV